MFRRNLLPLVVLPLLALVTACSSPVTARESEPTTPRVTPIAPAPSPSGAGTPGSPSAPSIDSGAPTGLSARTTAEHVWAEPIISGDIVTIQRSVASMSDHVHFEVAAQDASPVFVGYFVGPAFLIRPCICPTCGDEEVDWSGGTLACQACPASYDAVSGTAVGGGVCYPAGLVPHRIVGDSISMSRSDLLNAYERVVAGEGAIPVDGGDGSLPACCPNH